MPTNRLLRSALFIGLSALTGAAASSSPALSSIYRFSDGKIVEHWEASQAVTATSANGNDMF
jgi:predicted SnoaL-like aldol condensation-catalyzing enzyme